MLWSQIRNWWDGNSYDIYMIDPSIIKIEEYKFWEANNDINFRMAHTVEDLKSC